MEGMMKHRLMVLFVMALLLVTFVASTANACGWYQTCETEAWLKETLAPYLP